MKEENVTRFLSYKSYTDLISELFKEGKTTGSDQTDEYLGYTKMNIQRMSRLEKSVSLTAELKDILENVKQKYIWVVISEGWCGDSAQIIPLLNAIAEACLNIELKIILRDENPEIMDRYLTNGGRSIPKLICFEDESLKEIFTWGPRPKALQDIVMKLKEKNATKEEKGVIVQKWYNEDKTSGLQDELGNLIKTHMT